MKNSGFAFDILRKRLSSFIYRSFTVLLLASVLFACKTEVKQVEEKKQKPPEGFVYLENDSFRLAESTFFPKLMNYIICPREIDGRIILSPSLEYDDPAVFDSNTEIESEERLRTHFKVIKKMGFNSLRLVGLNQLDLIEADFETSIEVFQNRDRGNRQLNEKLTDDLVAALRKVVEIAREEELRIMLLLPKPMKNLNYSFKKKKYVEKILKTFSETPTIFAYDFFNEPIYFDNEEQENSKDRFREKSNAKALVEKWLKQMKSYAPNQLLTISFAEPIEVFEWDPSILPVDFVSIHTYHPLRVPNEIYWFSKYIKKPWIITETSLPADNDSIAYADQVLFLKEALQRTINCGGIGFGWWQYQDVKWGPFEHNYTPLISIGERIELDSNTYIKGQFKDAAFLLPKLPMSKNGDCDCHVNYYNMMGYNNYKIKGTVVDEQGRGIEGAVIRGWNEYWTIGMNTFTNQKGEFNLYSNDENVHFEISAPGYSRVSFYKELEYTPDPRTIKLEDVGLEYHGNHFQWYLDSTYAGRSVFTFDESLFSNYKTTASLGKIQLDKLDL